MKKNHICIAIIMLLLGNIIYSQNYIINFLGSGTTNQIDSVNVKNLVKNLEITLNGDEILNLGNVGIDNEYLSKKTNLEIFPNPFYQRANFNINVLKMGTYSVIITDISGKMIQKLSKNLDIGSHEFSINGLKEGIYLLRVEGEECMFNKKIISLNSNNYISNIEYKGKSGFQKNLKSTLNSVYMDYSDGDVLLFKAYSSKYISVLTDIPTSSKTITFEFFSCFDSDSNSYSTVKIGNQV